MRKVLIIFLVGFFLIINQKLMAQKNQELTYFYVENLTVSSYNEWIKSEDDSVQKLISYACVPAKIVGVRKEEAIFFKTKLVDNFTKVKQVELTQKQAEQKCATHRSY